jgi:hypothetical protein
MEVKQLGFLYVSLGSSTVQLHDSLGIRHACACSETAFSSENGDRARVCTTEEQRFLCVFVGKRTQLKGYP